MRRRLYQILTSARLAVLLLGLGLMLVFLGTMAQEPLGLYETQNRFFRSFFVDAASMRAALHKSADMFLQGIGRPLEPLDVQALIAERWIPIFPGAYLVGGLLLVNLFAVHLRYYRPGYKKWGLALIHLGVALLLLGQLLTDLLSTESSMHIRNGETKNYSESDRDYELAIVDVTDSTQDKIVAFPAGALANQANISQADLPFSLRVHTYYANSALTDKPSEGFTEIKLPTGERTGLWWRELARETEMNRRDTPSALIEFKTPQGSIGTRVVSGFLEQADEFHYNHRRYKIGLRLKRHYKTFSMQLVEFRHDKYPGTELPKNFSSRVRLRHADPEEDREALIYMNNPLRYGGETYYQSGFDPDNQGTILQVVRNPTWLSPYFSCAMVALGMVFQFSVGLVGFATKRKKA